MKLIQKCTFFVVFSLSIFSQIGLVQAQTFPIGKTWQISQKFKPRVDRKANPVSAGGASRGTSCLMEKQAFIPVIPLNQEALTLSKQPTFFWNMPVSSVKTMNFQIFADGEPVYEKMLNIPKQTGIVGFSLPKDAPELELNKSYTWYVTLDCNQEDSSNNPLINGVIKRIQPDSLLEADLKKTKSRNLSSVYAEAGIWQDGLSSIVQQRCTEPNNLIVRIRWRQYLESVGLNQLVNKPLVNSCTTNGK